MNLAISSLVTLPIVISGNWQVPKLIGMGSRHYRQMEQRIRLELEDGMGLRVDFFEMEEITAYPVVCAGWNDPVEAKLMV